MAFAKPERSFAGMRIAGSLRLLHKASAPSRDLTHKGPNMEPTFQSPLARKFYRIAGYSRYGSLGFLGFLGCLGFIPIPGFERLFGLSGLSGFSGLFGFAGFYGVASLVERRYLRNMNHA